MLNVLKFDIYKIFKSRWLNVFLICSAVLCFLNPILDYLILKSGTSVLSNMKGDNVPQFIIALFAVLFCTKDFSTGFISNFYSRQNKTAYVVSKIIILFTVTILFCALTFFIHCIFDKLFSYGEFYGEKYNDVNENLYHIIYIILFKTFGTAVFGVVIMLACFLVKNTVAMLIGTMTYMFFGEFLYRLIDGIVGNHFSFARYTSFGTINHLIISSATWEFTTSLIVLIVYFVVCSVLSVIAFYKKKF